MSFPRYPAYKESGIEWLGDVPAHWGVAALNFRYEVQLGKMLDGKRITGEHLAPYLRNVDVQWDRINVEDLPQMDFSGDDIERYGLRSGDLLVCEGGEVGRAAMWRGEIAECFYQKALHRLRARRDDSDLPRFQMYLLRAAADLGVFLAGEGKSTIAHLTAEALRRYRFAYPGPEEQARIADFLDLETAKIDALIAEQERLIVLLKEKRQAVISHAVTKGLDTDVPMKDSGVEWLGQVPAHWTVLPLGRVTVARCDGPFGSGLKTEHYTDEGARVIRLQNIRFGAFDDVDAAFIDLEYALRELAGHDVLPGDLLVAGLGDERNVVGRACVAPSGLGSALVKADCFRFRLDQARAEPSFVALQLSAGADAEGGRLATGTTRQRIALSAMSARRLALPPLAEQSTISRFIDRETAKIGALIAEQERGISLLCERRAALISAAVTGQINVCGAMERDSRREELVT